MTLNQLERRLRTFLAEHPSQMTFENFSEKWKSMDDLSRSIFECWSACPELFGGDNRISRYMERMGHKVERESVEDLLGNLEKTDSGIAAERQTP
jgi:hypothetical protein